MNAIFTIGIFLSFFQFVLLLNKKNKSVPDKIITFWMFTFGVHLLSYYLYSLGYWNKYPHLIGVTAPFPLLHGPLLFLYTLYSLRADKHLRKIDYLHFAPAVLSYLYMFKFFFFYSIEEKILVDSGKIDDFELFSYILLVALFISGLTYSILAYVKINSYKQLVDANFSYDEQISLNWLKYSIWGIACIFLTAAVIVLLREVAKINFQFNTDLIFYTLMVVFLFCIGFFGIQHQNIFSNYSELKQRELVQTQLPKEYKKSGLKQNEVDSIHQKLLKLMIDEKPFLNPKITLCNLAEQVDVSTNHLSQTINQNEKVNFHDFINRYRVDEFIERSKSNKNFSILAHALDSGFNSKSSFNSVFKKFKNETPSQYISKLNIL